MNAVLDYWGMALASAIGAAAICFFYHSYHNPPKDLEPKSDKNWMDS